MSFEPIQFGKYKLIQPLAQGGMAEIFLAKQQGPAGYEKTVVIKRVLSHYSSHPEFVAMFLDEARLAAQLSHPNIVQIYDFGETDGSYYLAMEYLRGEDLHTLVKLAAKKGIPIPPQVAATVVAASCDAKCRACIETALQTSTSQAQGTPSSFRRPARRQGATFSSCSSSSQHRTAMQSRLYSLVISSSTKDSLARVSMESPGTLEQSL